MKTSCNLLFLIGIASLLGCAENSGNKDATFISGVNKEHFDSKVNANEDFYQHANGKWLDQTEIPADRGSYGTFAKLREESLEKQRTILNEIQQNSYTPGSESQKVADLYNSFMDVETVNSSSEAAIALEFKIIDQIKTREDYAEYLAKVLSYGSSIFGYDIASDFRGKNNYIFYILQGGLSLSNREYYLKNDKNSAEIQSAYISHIEKSLRLANLDNANVRAKKIFAIERSFAEVHWTKEQLRDSTALYNKMNVIQIEAESSEFAWKSFFDAISESKIQELIVRTPKPIFDMVKVLSNTSLEDLKDYQRWRILNALSPFLSEEFVSLHFNFFGKILNGKKENPARWKRGVSLVDSSVGDAMGKLYVEKYFPPKAKEKMDTLVRDLLNAYRKNIKALDWMSETTKQKASTKLDKFRVKIGYPKKWKDYSELKIVPGKLVQNWKASMDFSTSSYVKRLNQPVDPEDWFITPQTVNAYYYPPANEIVFPAAILQPPFFNMNAEAAVNYGAIGAVIGHEIGHGFDDQGSQYDGNGKLLNWWTDDDRAAFKARTRKLIALYDGFKVFDDLKVNGTFTLGENIGDLGGVSIALDAYKISLDGKPAPVIDGLTGSQRFFYGWARAFATKYSNEELRLRHSIDPHSPAKYRVNGVMMNIPEFYEAFDVKRGDAMYLAPERRVKIW